MSDKRRWAPRGLAGMVAIGTIVVVTGVLIGEGAAVGQQHANARLAYTCPFASGAQQISIGIAATFPDSSAVGQHIQPTSGTVTVTVPRTALDGLKKLSAASVSGLGRLTTVVTQNGASENATWTNLVVSSTPLPATGNLVLAAPIAPPMVTPKAPGDITIDAADLVLVLSLKKADGSSTNPTTIPLACTIDRGQNSLLARIPVPISTSSNISNSNQAKQLAISSLPSPFAALLQHSAAPSAVYYQCAATPPVPDYSHLPPGWPDPQSHPPNAVIISGFSQPGCADVAGYSNVNKLNGSTFLAGPIGINAGTEIMLNLDPVTHLTTEYHFYNLGQTIFPATTSTFLAFGFMPVTAAMQLTQIGQMPIVADQKVILNQTTGTVDFYGTVTASAQMTLRVYDVLINGVPFNVGDTCRASQPINVTLTGPSDVIDGKPVGYSVSLGGPLFGHFDIPAFIGCGIGENLDPILNASITSLGNYIEITQGPLCSVAQPPPFNSCPPVAPKPRQP